MRLILILLFLSLLAGVRAQESTEVDTLKVYEVAESMPFPLINSCNPNLHPGWTADSVRRCGEGQLLSILARNIRYPAEAREKDIQGTVVVNFIVERNGKMSDYKILKDIGGGCGEESLRVLQSLQDAGLTWMPAVFQKKPVRMKYSLPLKFKLEESKAWYFGENGDSIYTLVDKQPAFKAGIDSLYNFLLKKLEYPAEHAAGCKTGIIEMTIKLDKAGAISVENSVDFNNLGLDFQWQATRLANLTAGMWEPAEFEGKKVSTVFPLRALFKSPSKNCTLANENFDKAMLLLDEGARHMDEQKTDEAIQAWTRSLELSPFNGEILYYRGTAYLSQNKREEACADFEMIKKNLGITWFEPLRRMMCGM